jgi:hypothetical protein
MAYLYVRRNGRVDIREAVSTQRGPRSRTLVSFQPPLTDEHLQRAQSAATRPFDREAIVARARNLGVAVAQPSADPAAHRLIARLRGGAPLDPLLAGALREQLSRIANAPLPGDLAEVIEWVGASDHERGRALRDVLRLYDTIMRSRAPVAEPPARRFPRFGVRPRPRAS